MMYLVAVALAEAELERVAVDLEAVVQDFECCADDLVEATVWEVE